MLPALYAADDRAEETEEERSTEELVVVEPFRDDIDQPPVQPDRRPDILQLEPYKASRHIVRTTKGIDRETLEFELAVDRDVLNKFPSRLEHQTWIAGSTEGGITVDITDGEWWVVTDTMSPPQGPYKLEEESPWGTIPLAMKAVRTTEVDTFRLTKLHRLDALVATQARNTETGEVGTAVFSRMTVRTKVTLPASPVPMSEIDPYALSLLTPEVANPEHLELLSTQPVDPTESASLNEWNALLASAAERAPLLHAKLPRGGVYALTGSDLQRVGVDPGSLDVATLRFFLGTEEISVTTHSLTRGRLLGDGRIFFYIPPDPTDKKPFYPLWILQAAPGEVPMRTPMAERSSGTAISVPGTVTTRIFEPAVFNHKMPHGAPQLKWSTADLSTDEFATFEFEARGIDPNGTAMVDSWQTALEGGSFSLHLLINGTEVHASEEMRGMRPLSRVAQFPASLLREGTNTLTVWNQLPEKDISAPISFIHADVTFPVQSEGLQHQRLFTMSGDLPDTATLRVGNANMVEGTAFLADVTAPNRPRFNIGHIIGKGTYGVSAMFSFGKDPLSQAQLVAFNSSTALPLTGLTKVEPPTAYTATEQADLLIIAHPTLVEALEPLIEHRSKKYKVAVVTTDDAYAAFSGGHLRYESIHQAIQRAFAHRTAPLIQSVLLVGEGSEYWWENRRPSAGITPNLLPIYGWQNPDVHVRGDDSYSLVVGDGPLADVEMGRISTEDPEELKGVIDKIIAYETAPPPGDWLHRHLFVTDDEPEFRNVTKEIVTKTLVGANVPVFMFLQEYPYEDYFRLIWRKRSATMTEDLIRQWREGALTINYLGHGGPNLWSSERILHNRDVENINCEGRHPFLVAGSCDTGWVDYPVEPVRASLAEQLVRNPVGGAIAAFIPIDGTSSFEHNFLLTAFYEALLVRNHRRAGTLSLLAKLNYHLPRNNARVTNQYLLMGDPLLQLPLGARQMSVKVSPTEFLYNEGGSISVSGRFAGIPWGVVDVMLLDPYKQVAASERLRLVNTAFEGELKLPESVDPGNYTLVTIARSEESGEQGSATTPITFHNHRIRFAWSTVPALDAPLPAGTTVKVTVTVENQSPKAVEKGILVISDHTGTEVMRNEVAIAANDRFDRTFDVPLPPGLNALTGQFFLSEAKGRPVSEDKLLLLASSPDQRPIDLSVPEAFVEYMPTLGGTRITLPAYALAPAGISRAVASLSWRRGEEWLSMGERRIAALPFGQQRWMSFRTKELLPVGAQDFRLELRDHETTNVLATIPLTIDLADGHDIAVENVFVENQNPRAGNTVFVRGTIKNLGRKPAYHITPVLYLDTPWVDSAEATTAVPWNKPEKISVLYPGESREVRTRWDPQGVAASRHTLHLAAASDQVEGSLANNVAPVTIDLLASSNLRIVKDEVLVSHQIVQPYDVVRFSLPVVNDSPYDFRHEFRVMATAYTSDGSSRRLFSRRFDSLQQGERVTIQFDWTVGPGEEAVEINENVDREYLELSYDDNIHRLTFPTVFPASFLGLSASVLDYDKVRQYGNSTNIRQLPGGKLTVARAPKSGRVSLPFLPQQIVEGRLGPNGVMDNLWDLMERTQLVSRPGEVAAPVKFRIPLPRNDDTTYYAFELPHVENNPKKETPQGIFRYRLEDQVDWTIEDRPAGKADSLGRIDTFDDHLTIELATPDTAPFNHLFGLTATPLVGTYTSAILVAEKLPVLRLVADLESPGLSQVLFDVRYGKRSEGTIEWQDWARVERGSALPVAAAGHQYFQWRARLVEATDGNPTLRSVRFEVGDRPVRGAGEERP
jgi:hypothetical protein